MKRLALGIGVDEFGNVVIGMVTATGGDHDGLRAKADAKIAADPAFASGLRPKLLELRGMNGEARKAAYAALLEELGR